MGLSPVWRPLDTSDGSPFPAVNSLERIDDESIDSGQGSKMRRTVAVVAVAAALGVTGGTAVAVSQSGSTTSVRTGAVSTPTTVPGGSNGGTEGMRHRREDVLRDVLAGLVAKGTITQAQADAIIDAMDKARAAHRPRAPHASMEQMFGQFRNAEKAVADVIGITPEQLRDELMKGSTIGDIAKAHGVPVSKVVDAVVAQASTFIDQAVHDGRLTAEQATKMKDGLRDLATKLLDGKGFGFDFGRGFGGDHPMPGGPGGGFPPPSTPASPVPSTTAPSTTAAPAPTAAPPTTASNTTAAPTTTD